MTRKKLLPNEVSTEIVLGQDLPQDELKRLIRISKAHTRKVNSSRIVYPDKHEVDLDGPDAEFEIKPDGFLSNRLGVVSRKSGKGGGKKKPKLPNPTDVLQEVQNALQGLPLATATGDLVIGEFNAEFLDLSKAKYFDDTYEEILRRVHLLHVVETDNAGLQHIAGLVPNYRGYCSTANTRGQAVGFAVNPRLKLRGNPIEYPQVGNVQGIPDLRPAYRLNLTDSHTKEDLDDVVVHLKSMRGGPQQTANVRYRQLDILQQLLGSSFKGIVGGDFNFILNNPALHDGDPLKKNGYSLFMPNDATATQSMGSRIDGFFLRNLTGWKVTSYQVFAFFRNPKIGRAFSDHALLTFLVLSPESKEEEKDKPVDVVARLVPILLDFDALPEE